MRWYAEPNHPVPNGVGVIPGTHNLIHNDPAAPRPRAPRRGLWPPVWVIFSKRKIAIFQAFFIFPKALCVHCLRHFRSRRDPTNLPAKPPVWVISVPHIEDRVFAPLQRPRGLLVPFALLGARCRHRLFDNLKHYSASPRLARRGDAHPDSAVLRDTSPVSLPIARFAPVLPIRVYPRSPASIRRCLVAPLCFLCVLCASA
jgi:hypothetical protein